MCLTGLVIGVWDQGCLSENGQLPGSCSTKGEASACQQSTGSPEPVLPLVRESLGATSCESPPVGNCSCGCTMPGRESSTSLILSLKSPELDVMEHRRLRQDDHEFQASLASVARSCLKEADR